MQDVLRGTPYPFVDMRPPPLAGPLGLLFTDIEGSTRILTRLGRRYVDVLEDHLRVLQAAIGRGGGELVDTQGDALFALFPSAEAAVGAALASQHALATHPWPPEGEVRVRMGVHLGWPLPVTGGFTGLAVHEAARICAAGHGGQVLASDDVRRAVTPRFRFRPLGRFRLAGFDEPHHIHQLLDERLQTEFPPLRAISCEASRDAARPEP